ncbi:hypothetical protein OAB57_01340 [Bacteriovoracaceae bacterium]|nr:hypothetical protein [Bacteriovoracaceae bacterium]
MNSYSIFCDASFSSTRKISVLGYLCLKEEDDLLDATEEMVCVKEVSAVTNIRSELECIIWALESIQKTVKDDLVEIQLYTDCESLAGLINRRDRLFDTEFISKRQKKELSNADLYRVFFDLVDDLNPEISWVKGHMPNSKRNFIQSNFALVDRTVRKLRRNNNNIAV